MLAQEFGLLSRRDALKYVIGRQAFTPSVHAKPFDTAIDGGVQQPFTAFTNDPNPHIRPMQLSHPVAEILLRIVFPDLLETLAAKPAD